MGEKDTKKQIKYDFSNLESQKLFEEFSILLAEVTKYSESQSDELISVKNKLVKIQRENEEITIELKKIQEEQKELLARLQLVTSSRYMVKAIYKKIIDKLRHLHK